VKLKLELIDKTLISSMVNSVEKDEIYVKSEDLKGLMKSYYDEREIVSHGDGNASNNYKKDIQELFKRTDGITELEKRWNRILRDLDVNTLVKTVRQKADQDDVKKEIMIVDTKIISTAE